MKKLWIVFGLALSACGGIEAEEAGDEALRVRWETSLTCEERGGTLSPDQKSCTTKDGTCWSCTSDGQCDLKCMPTGWR